MGSVGEIVLEEVLERRVVLVMKIGEKLLRIVCTAWRHGAVRQAPYQRCEGCSGSKKCCFSYFSRNKDRPAVVQSRQAPPSTFGR